MNKKNEDGDMDYRVSRRFIRFVLFYLSVYYQD